MCLGEKGILLLVFFGVFVFYLVRDDLGSVVFYIVFVCLVVCGKGWESLDIVSVFF